MEEWWNRPLRVLQFNFEDRLGLYVPRISGRSVARTAAEIGANVVVVFARDAWGYTYYRGGRAGPPRPGMKGDFLRELVEEAHRLGIRVVAMVAHTANKLLYLKHSDWAQVNYRGELILLEHAPAHGDWEAEWPQMCPNSPFIDHAMLEVREAVSLGVDGILFDSFRYQPDPERACYCRWCRERFRRETGHEMPVEPDWSNSVWRMLWDWRYRVVVEALAKLAREAKRVKRSVMVIYNSHPAGWAGRANRVVEMARSILDGVFAEASEADFQPPGFLAEMVKLTRAMAGDGKRVFASRNAFHQLKPTMPAPPVLIRQGLREVIAAGGDPWVLVFSSQFILDNSWRRAVKQVFEEHRVLEEYLYPAKPVEYAAILVSNTVRDHYGRLEPHNYVDETRGFYYALTWLHIPTTYVVDRDVAEKGWSGRLLVLADTACVGEKLVESLSRFLEAGGKLIATYKTGFYDGDCLPRGGNIVADLLGFQPAGEVVEADWAYIRVKENHPITRGLKDYILVGDTRRVLEKPLKLASHVPVEPTEDATTPLILVPAAYRYGHEYTLGRSSPPPGSRGGLPAAIVGRGTVYFPWRVGANYWYTGSPELLRLVENTATYLAGSPPVYAKAPRTVLTEYWMQGERIIVHMVNYTGPQRILAASFTGGRQPLPPYSGGPPIHPLDEVTPVPDIEVFIDTKLLETDRVKAYSPLTGKKFETIHERGKLRVKVDRLEEYEVIVVEPA